MSQDDDDNNLDNQYDINLVKAEIDQIQRAAIAAATAAQQDIDSPSAGDTDPIGTETTSTTDHQENGKSLIGIHNHASRGDDQDESMIDSSFLVHAANDARQQQQQQQQQQEQEDQGQRHQQSSLDEEHAAQNNYHHQHHLLVADDQINGDPAGATASKTRRQTKRKRAPLESADGIKKCSRCRVKRLQEAPELLEKYATCFKCRSKRKIDNRHKHAGHNYRLPSAEATAHILTEAMNASREDQNGMHQHQHQQEHAQQHQQQVTQLQPKKKQKKSRKLSTALAENNDSAIDPDNNDPVNGNTKRKTVKPKKSKDFSKLPNLYTNYNDFVERVRLNCDHDLFNHHFRGYTDENLLSRYEFDEVDADVFHIVSRKVMHLYIQPLMDVTGYRFPVRDYHKGGSKSKRITFMFICSQDQAKQRKSRSTALRKRPNRLKTNNCDSKINLNYDLCSGLLQINFNHKAHPPYMWKADSVYLQKHSGHHYIEEPDTYNEHGQMSGSNEELLENVSQDPEAEDMGDHRHHHHHEEDHRDHDGAGEAEGGEHDDDAQDDDNLDLNLMDSIPASSMHYLTGVEEDVAAVVSAEQERARQRQAELDRAVVEAAASQFLQAQASHMKEHNHDDEEDEHDGMDDENIGAIRNNHSDQMADDDEDDEDAGNIDEDLLRIH